MAGDANVRILISAITEAAESQIEDVGDKLAGTGLDAEIAQSGLDEVGDELDDATTRSGLLYGALGELGDKLRDTIVPAALLQSELDEVGDESAEAAAKAGLASGAFSTLTLSSDGAAVSVGALSGALTVALLPALALLVTSLAPVAGALGVAAAGAAGLAGAFGLVVGSGMVAYGGQLKKSLNQTKNEVKGLVAAFGQQFVPLIRQGIDAIPDLVRNILKATGSMAPFKRALRDAGAVAFEVLPKVVSFFFDLARKALPYARELTGFLLNNARPAFMAMWDAAAQLESEFRSLLSALVTFAPALLKFGTIAASVVLPAVTALIKGITMLFNIFSSPPAAFAPAMQRAATSLGRLQTALAPLYAALGRLTPELLALGATVVSVTSKMAAAAVPVLTRIVNAVTAAVRWFNNLSPPIKRAAIQVGVLAAALGPALGILGALAAALGVLLSPIGLVTAAIVGLSIAWQKNLFGIRDITKQAFGVLRGLFQQAVTWIRPLIPTVAQLTGIWKKHRAQVVKAANGVKTTLLGYKKTILGLVGPLLGFKTQTASVGKKMRGLGKAIREGGQGPAQRLSNFLKSVLIPTLGVGVIGALGLVVTTFRGTLASALKFVIGKFGGLVVGSTRVRNAVAVLQGVVLKVATALKGRLATAALFVKGKIGGLAKILFGRLFPAFSRVGGFITRIGGLLGGRLVGAVVSAIARFGSFALTVGRVGSAVSLLTNPIGIVIAAVLALYLAWKKNLFGIRDKTKEILGAVKAAFRGDTSKLKGITSNAVGQIRKTWGKLQKIWQDTKRILRKVGQVALAGMRWLWKNAITPVLDSIKKQWDRHGDQILDSINQLFNFLKGIFKVALGVLMVIWDRWGGEIQAAAKFIMDTVGSVINTGLDVILTAFDVITDFMAGEWDTGLNKIWDLAKRIFGGIINFVKKWGSGFLKWVTGLVSDAFQAFVDWGQDLIFGSLIPEIFSAIIDAVVSFAGNFLKKIGSFVSDNIKKFGELKDKAIKKVNDLKDQVLTKAGKLVSSTVRKIGKLPGKARQKFEDMRSAAAKKFRDMLSVGKRWSHNLLKSVGDIIGGLKKKARNAGKGLINGFKGAINSGKKKVKKAARGVVKAVRKLFPGSDAEEGPLSDLSKAGAALPGTLAKHMLKNTHVAQRAAAAVAAAARPDLSGAGAVGLNSTATARALEARLRTAGMKNDGDTNNAFEISIDLSGSATREDGERVADGLVDSLRTYNIDRI